jgi:hypothetical protein
MVPHNLPHNGQTDPGPTAPISTTASVIQAREPLEDSVSVLRPDTAAAVRHRDLGRRLGRCQPNRDERAGVVTCVVAEIAQQPGQIPLGALHSGRTYSVKFNGGPAQLAQSMQFRQDKVANIDKTGGTPRQASHPSIRPSLRHDWVVSYRLDCPSAARAMAT